MLFVCPFKPLEAIFEHLKSVVDAEPGKVVLFRYLPVLQLQKGMLSVQYRT